VCERQCAATRKNKQLTIFSDLRLSAPILKALQDEGYREATAIQAMAIPIVLAGRDLLGIAQTGTGKTAAFALPIIHRLAADHRPARPKGCRVLVLSPTRELATQIAESFRAYGRYFRLSVTVVFGGVGHRPQIQALARGVDVLVATPGRLLDHIAERHMRLAETEILVLDEADQMLDLGFLLPIRRIVSQLPARRQNLFFSATMPPEIARLADELLRDPIKVAVTPTASTVASVSQRVLHIESRNKRALLVELFADRQMSRALVFTRTKRGADRVARHLELAGIRVAAIHGNKSQSQREQALAAFRTSRIRALVATDIAARGIDVDQVTHVVNYELPDVPESYVHRIGRTARAGAQGIAISLCDADERDQLRDIERLIRQPILPRTVAKIPRARPTNQCIARRSSSPAAPTPANRQRREDALDPCAKLRIGLNAAFAETAPRGPCRSRSALPEIVPEKHEHDRR
jgi:ATP-dependent RNA helicase RhlE